MGRAETPLVGSTDTLIIKTRLPNSKIVRTVDIAQTARTRSDVQALINDLVDDHEAVIGVWLVEAMDHDSAPLSVVDIADQFVDLTPKQARQTRAHMADLAESIVPFNPQSAYGTLNHAQQGLA